MEAGNSGAGAGAGAGTDTARTNKRKRGKGSRGKRKTTLLSESEDHIQFVDVLTGDRVFIPVDTESEAIAVTVSLATSEKAVERAAKIIGFRSARSCGTLRRALEQIEGRTRTERIRTVRDRLGCEHEVVLVPETEGISNLSGTLTLKKVTMESTGPRASQRVRRRVGVDTVVAYGTLVVHTME